MKDEHFQNSKMCLRWMICLSAGQVQLPLNFPLSSPLKIPLHAKSWMGWPICHRACPAAFVGSSARSLKPKKTWRFAFKGPTVSYLLDNPEEAVVVVPAEPKLKADGAVVLEPNEPKENPEVSCRDKTSKTRINLDFMPQR